MTGRDGATDGARGSPLLTKREAAAFCRVSLRTFERFVQRHLPAVQIGARLLFATEDLNRWLATRRRALAVTPTAAIAPPASPSRSGGALSSQESEILAHIRSRNPPARPMSER